MVCGWPTRVTRFRLATIILIDKMRDQNDKI
jgi:hypothetical protein